MSKSLHMLTGSALLLASCNGQQPGNGTTASPAAASTTAGFNAADACATLPKEKVAALTGLQVSEATLSRVTPATSDSAAFSQCSYSFAGGGTLDFFARQSPIDDNTPEAIQRTRQGMTDNMGAKTSDVAGLGEAAFAVDQMHQLHIFFAGNRYIYFMTASPPAGKPVLELEKALARAVIG
jgi:hypothetical protein